MFAALRRLFTTNNNSTPAPLAEPMPAPVQTKSAEVQLTEALTALRSSLREEETRLYHESRDRRAADEQRLAEALQFVKQTGLDEAMLAVQRETWHWPSWLSKQPQAVHATALGLSQVSADESAIDSGTLTRVRFTFQDRPYAFEFEQRRGMAATSGSHYGTLRFFSGDDQVLRLSIYHDLEAHREYDQWSLLHVELIRPGEWMARLLELEHRIRVRRQQSFDEFNTKLAADRARDLPAPGELPRVSGEKRQRT